MSTPSKPTSGGQRAYTWRVCGLGVLACAALSAGSYLLGVRPALGRQAERVAAEQDLKDHLAQAERAAADLVAVRRRLVVAGEELAALPLRLEPASGVNRRLNELAQVAAAAGVTLNEVQPQPAVDGPHYQTVPIRVAGTGSYPACAAFLHALRARFPDTSVRAFEAVNPAAARTGNVATFRVELAWHTEAAAPAAAPPRK